MKLTHEKKAGIESNVLFNKLLYYGQDDLENGQLESKHVTGESEYAKSPEFRVP